MNALSVQLDQLQDTQLVRPLVEDEPGYISKHALTQETADQSLRLKNRREIHRHVAQSSEGLAADRLEEVAALVDPHHPVSGDESKRRLLSRSRPEITISFTLGTWHWSGPKAKAGNTRRGDATWNTPSA